MTPEYVRAIAAGQTPEPPDAVNRRDPWGRLRARTAAVRLGPAVLFLGLVLVLSAVAPLSAQNTGSVTGQVTAAATAQPLGGAQVSIQNVGLGTLTDSNGRFLIPVPAGSHVVAVTFIGYGTASQEVTVAPGQEVEVLFSLQAAAIDLDAIVVTGTGAPTQRRRLGQTISSVDASDIEFAPVATVTQALQGRVPGLSGAIGNRETGQADLPVLRGLSSLTQRNTPVIYIDGIRMNNAQFSAAGLVTDQLSQLNPSDVDRIEVIKGAAAATLFGTEASSGVIQIFTKRGQIGAPSYSLQTDQQLIAMKLENFPANFGYDPTTRQILRDKPADQWVDLGHHQNYTLSIRGGTPATRYFVSGRFMNEDAPMPNNHLRNSSLRTTLDFQHTENLRSSIDANLMRNYLEAPRPSWSSIASEMMLANPVNATPERPHGEQDFTVAGSLRDRDYSWTTTGMIGGSLAYDITDGILAQAKIGHHRATLRRERMRPEGEVLGLAGIRQVWGSEIASTTMEASLGWEAQFSDRIQSSFVVGGQRFYESEVNDEISVEDFASPTLQTIRGGSRVTGYDEFTEEVINAGVFAQEQIGLDNRLFLTVGMRMDGNSAFGEDFGLEFYPKAGLSWVVSEHDFFDFPGIDELRLRGAFGTSGLQPGAFDAQRTWAATSFIGGAALEPLNQGNAELKPERSRELEFAVEAGFLNSRLGIEAVYFTQRTEDALLPASPPPSTGFTSSQLRNLGEVSTNGVELSADLRALERSGLTWDVNAAFTRIEQTVTDMGGVPDFRMQTRYRWGHIAEGYSPGAVITPVADPDQPYILTVPVEDLTSVGQILPNTLKNSAGGDSLVWVGNPQPTWGVDFGTTLRIGDNLTLQTLFSGAGGDYVISYESGLIRTVTDSNFLSAWAHQILDDPNATTAQKQEVADEYGRKHPDLTSNWMEQVSYLRWSELSLTYQLPEAWSGRFGLRQSSVSVGGRNLMVWTGYSGMMDPGAAPNGWPSEVGVFGSNIDYISAPSTRRYTLTFRTTW